MSYVLRDVVVVFGLAAAAAFFNNWAVWPLYWIAQGSMFWALFVLGHDWCFVFAVLVEVSPIIISLTVWLVIFFILQFVSPIMDELGDPPVEKNSEGPIDRDAVLARVETEKRLALIKAWEESEKTKAENK